MKQLKFNISLNNNQWSFVTKDKKYQIYLPNKAIQVHANKKDALSFIAKTSKLYNQSLIEVNSIFIEVWAKYQAYWFVLDMQESIQIDQLFKNITNQFYQMIKIAAIPDNGLYHVYQKINICTDELKLIIHRLIKLFRKLNYHQEAASTKLLINRINHVTIDLNNWGFDENHDNSGRFNEDLSIKWIDLI
ncbi:MAG: hypothetical protein JXR34_11925 [Bacteroidales bacterium]|nr:hypothetical protein [Bacteroidales bacterium]